MWRLELHDFYGNAEIGKLSSFGWLTAHDSYSYMNPTVIPKSANLENKMLHILLAESELI